MLFWILTSRNNALLIKNEFSKRKMELNALEEKCLNWKDEFDKDFKVCISGIRNVQNTCESLL